MLININRTKIFEIINNDYENIDKEKIQEYIKDELIFEHEDLIKSYKKFLEYSKKYNYRSALGDLERENFSYGTLGYYSKKLFVNIIAEMIRIIIIKDIEICKKYGKKNKFNRYYLPLDVKLEYRNLVPEYKFNGRLGITAFDWSTNKDNDYDYSFNLCMDI